MNHGFNFRKLAALASILIIFISIIRYFTAPAGSLEHAVSALGVIAVIFVTIGVWILYFINLQFKNRTGESFLKNRILGRDSSSSILQAYDKSKRDNRRADDAKRNRTANPTSDHPQGIIFGRKNERWVFSPAIGAAAPHAMVYGPTGSGKTQAIILPSIAAWPKNLHIFGVDVSGDITATIQSNKWMRSNFCSIDFTTWSAPIRYDIFESIRGLANDKTKPEDEVKSEQETKIEEIAQCLIPLSKPGDNSNAYFTDGGRDLLTAALLAGFFNGRGFVETLIWLTESSNPFQEIEKSNVHSAVVKVRQFAGQNQKNVSGVRGEAVKAAQKITKNGIAARVLTPPKAGETAKLLSPSDIEKSDIFIRIKMTDLVVLSPVIGLLLRQLTDYFYTRDLLYASSNPVLIVSDELSSYAKYWMGLTNDLRNLRKFGGRFLFCTQDFGSLDEAIGKAKRETIVANCGYKIILNSSVPSDQKDISDLIGKEEVKRRSQTYSPYAQSSYTDRWEMLPAVPPEDLGTLAKREQLILISPDGWEQIETAPFWKYSEQLKQDLQYNNFFYKALSQQMVDFDDSV